MQKGAYAKNTVYEETPNINVNLYYLSEGDLWSLINTVAIDTL